MPFIFLMVTSGLEAGLSHHTVDYVPFIKSQLDPTKSTWRPYVVPIWSRTAPESRVNKTLVVHRVAPPEGLIVSSREIEAGGATAGEKGAYFE